MGITVTANIRKIRADRTHCILSPIVVCACAWIVSTAHARASTNKISAVLLFAPVGFILVGEVN
jgi:hypothetical protein